MLTLFKPKKAALNVDLTHNNSTDDDIDISVQDEDEFYIPVLKPAPWLFTKEVEKRREEEKIAKKYSVQKEKLT